MRKLALFLAWFVFSTIASGQTSAEVEAVVEPIKQLFDAMRASDTTKLRATFHPEAKLMTTYTDKAGEPQVQISTVDDFVQSIGRPHEEVYDEKIWSYDVNIDDNLATAWTDYTFYVGEQMSHCGVNAFQLAKTTDGWKIIHITDTRRRDNCQTQEEYLEPVLNAFMDSWHKAAATANEEVFFGSMTEDGIYIGTDASEYWTRDEMKAWAKDYFERDTAWDFTPLERNFYFSGDRQTAWFDEKLDTWMGICRGSGVLQKTADDWRIKHYVLSVTVPNESINGFLELIGKEQRK